MKRIIRNVAALFGLEVQRIQNTDTQLKKLLDLHTIDTILDVGANNGQFALKVLNSGFKGKIISFEPQKEPYNILEEKSLENQRWHTQNEGLGSVDHETKINTSLGSHCSSILQNKKLLTKDLPEAKYVGQEKIKIKTLDTVFKKQTYGILPRNTILLKMDVQGYESKVLDGAKKSIKYIDGIHLECHFEPLYEGEPPFSKMLQRLETLGFKVWLIQQGYIDRTGRMLNFDALLFR